MLTEGQILIGRYDIVRQLKKGGMGAVYEAFDNLLDAPVAVKENCLEDPSMRAAFQREAQLLANLRHPSLPRCSDLLSEGEGQYLVMEFIGGDDLAALMVKRRTWLSNEAVADIAWQLLDVLEYVHGEAIVHRDIKPSNIKLMDGRAYLLDFGIAYGQSGEMDTIDVKEFNWKYRSKRYSPIEQTRCRRTSPASDLYSLAATLYFLLTNVEPTDAEERFESVSRGGEDPLEDVRFYNPAANEDVSRAIMQALSLGANERPQSAAEMREMMFHEVGAEAEAGGLRSFLTARLLSGVVVLGVLAYLVFFFPGPRGTRQAYIPDQPTTTLTPKPSPVEPVATPTPREEAARLSKEAEFARQSGQDERAWSLLERALTLDDTNPYVHYLVGDIMWEAIVDNGELGERVSEVQEQADQILRLVRTPRSEQECVALAWANLAKATLGRARPDPKRLDKAFAAANEALTKYAPDSVAALTIRATATYTKAGTQINEQTAHRVLEDYERAITLAPKYAQAHVNRGGIYLTLVRLGKAPSRAEYLEHARQGLEKAVELWERPSFYKQLGDAYLEMGDTDKAIEAFNAAATLDANYFQAYIGLGNSFFKKGRWEDAKINYLRANSLNQTSVKSRKSVLKKLYAIYNNLEQHDLAAESWREVLKPDPNDAEVKQELARAPVGRGAGNSSVGDR
jgi:serine/threonine protein kinase/Tfp pilus assembly protein PilF